MGGKGSGRKPNPELAGLTKRQRYERKREKARERWERVKNACRHCGSCKSDLFQQESGVSLRKCSDCGRAFPQSKAEIWKRARQKKRDFQKTPEGRADRRCRLWAKYLYTQLKQRSRGQGCARKIYVHPAIRTQWIKDQFQRQQGRCFYTGISFVIDDVKRGIRRPSIDRIDSTLGYTPKNTVLCLTAINYMKNDYTVDEFMTLLLEIAGM